jgi:hypothetical protein
VSRAAVETSECLNCGTPLTGRYCSACGQKSSPLNPTFRHLAQELAHELLNVDGKIFRSTRLLLARPGFLTREYFDGRQARYVSPIRLYLIFSVAFFALSAVVDREPIFEADEDIEVGALGRMLGLGEMSPAEANARVDRAQTEWMPRVMFILVPVCAALVAVVTRTSGKNYPQHLYFALHIHSAYFAVLILATVLELFGAEALGSIISILGTSLIIGYSVVAFRTAYGGRWRLAAGRVAFVFVTYMMVVGLALVGVAVAAASG